MQGRTLLLKTRQRLPFGFSDDSKSIGGCRLSALISRRLLFTSAEALPKMTHGIFG
jgi:hypothetical protein